MEARTKTRKRKSVCEEQTYDMYRTNQDASHCKIDFGCTEVGLTTLSPMSQLLNKSCKTKTKSLYRTLYKNDIKPRKRLRMSEQSVKRLESIASHKCTKLPVEKTKPKYQRSGLSGQWNDTPREKKALRSTSLRSDTVLRTRSPADDQQKWTPLSRVLCGKNQATRANNVAAIITANSKALYVKQVAAKTGSSLLTSANRALVQEEAGLSSRRNEEVIRVVASPSDEIKTPCSKLLDAQAHSNALRKMCAHNNCIKNVTDVSLLKAPQVIKQVIRQDDPVEPSMPQKLQAQKKVGRKASKKKPVQTRLAKKVTGKENVKLKPSAAVFEKHAKGEKAVRRKRRALRPRNLNVEFGST